MSAIDGKMYTCDCCGKEMFVSNAQLNVGGLKPCGIFKIEIGASKHLCGICFSAVTQFIEQYGKTGD